MAARIDGIEEITADDLDRLPPDGKRWELIAGTLHVTPAPSGPHQTIAGNLYGALRAARPQGLAVMVAPFDLRPDDRTSLQPDVLVVTAAEAAKLRTALPPLLVVEVLSPGSRADDLGSKRLVYEALGIPSYWIVDPAGPTLTELCLSEGRYVEMKTVGADEAFRTDVPFAVELLVGDLLLP
jgi:Uma2 family endonuclease